MDHTGGPTSLRRRPTPPSADQQARNTQAFGAVVAKVRSMILTDPAAVDLVRDLMAAFADSRAPRGPTKAEVWDLIRERRTPSYSEDFFASRWAVLEHYQAIEPYQHKKYQHRYAPTPALAAAALVYRRLRAGGGIDELISLLEDTGTLLQGEDVDRQEIADNLELCRQTLIVYAIHLERLVRDGSVPELMAEQQQHNHTDLRERVLALNEAVARHFPKDTALDQKAAAVLKAEQRYEHWLVTGILKVLDQGGRTLDFDILPEQDYHDAARFAPLAQLAGLGTDLVVDPPSVWIDAGALLDAVQEYAPRTRVRQRPPMPMGPPEPDPVHAMGERRTFERVRLEALADRTLQERDQVELTEELRRSRWPHAARLLADLIALDADPHTPYHLRIGIEMIIDVRAWVTYLHPVVLHRTQPAAPDPNDTSRTEPSEPRHEKP